MTCSDMLTDKMFKTSFFYQSIADICRALQSHHGIVWFKGTMWINLRQSNMAMENPPFTYIYIALRPFPDHFANHNLPFMEGCNLPFVWCDSGHRASSSKSREAAGMFCLWYWNIDMTCWFDMVCLLLFTLVFGGFIGLLYICLMNDYGDH